MYTRMLINENWILNHYNNDILETLVDIENNSHHFPDFALLSVAQRELVNVCV